MARVILMYVHTTDCYKYGSLRRVHRRTSKIESITHTLSHCSSPITLHFNSCLVCATSDSWWLASSEPHWWPPPWRWGAIPWTRLLHEVRILYRGALPLWACWCARTFQPLSTILSSITPLRIPLCSENLPFLYHRYTSFNYSFAHEEILSCECLWFLFSQEFITSALIIHSVLDSTVMHLPAA